MIHCLKTTSSFQKYFKLIAIICISLICYINYKLLTTPHNDVRIKKLVTTNQKGLPMTYEEEVDFRIIVMTHNRHTSLQTLLSSLQQLQLDGHTAALEIWIDPDRHDKVDLATLGVAINFGWLRGPSRVHVHSGHVGIYGQWIDTWRPFGAPPFNTSAQPPQPLQPQEPQGATDVGSGREIALLLEDDMVVSSEAYRFVRAVHDKYAGRRDFAGVSINNVNVKAHNTAKVLKAPQNHSVYMYACIGTWGFSPSPRHWTHFQDWYHDKQRHNDLVKQRQNDMNNKTITKKDEKSTIQPTNSTTKNSTTPTTTTTITTTTTTPLTLFHPLVEGVRPSVWYQGFLKSGHEGSMWSMWFIYFAYHRKLYTVYCNLNEVNANHESNIGYNRLVGGLHYQGNGIQKAERFLLTNWREEYKELMPEQPIKFDWTGKALNQSDML